MLRQALRLSRLRRQLSSPAAAASAVQPAQTPAPPPPLDFFEDDVLDHLFSPRVAMPGPSTKSRADDIFLYAPEEQPAYERQLKLEEEVLQTAITRMRKISRDATSRGDVVSNRPAADLLASWFGPLTLALRPEVQQPTKEGRRRNRRAGGGRNGVAAEVAKKLALLPSDAVSVIAIHVVLGALMREANGVPLARLAFLVGNTVRAEINMQKITALRREQEKAARNADEREPEKKQRSARAVLQNALASSTSTVSAVNYAAQQVAVQDARWEERDVLLLGTHIIDRLVRVAQVDDGNGNFEPAFSHFKRFRKADMVLVGCLQLTDAAMRVISEDDNCLADCVTPKQQPMLVRPRPWVSPRQSPYLSCHANLIRTEARFVGRVLDSALDAADLSVLYDGLNALGDTEWQVNKRVLEAAEVLWNCGGGMAGLVTKTDVEVPKKKAFLEMERRRFEEERIARQLRDQADNDGDVDESDDVFNEKRARWRLRMERRKAQKSNRELISQRADTMHKIENARRFADEERIWLPHNVDFRGRAYPIPVYLQHMGCDLTRATLTFAKPGIELGPRGVYWLKVHLANKLGGDKLSFKERVEFAEENMSKAISVGQDPLSDANLEWWGKAEDPFQLLAACQDLANGFGRHGGELALEGYKSSLPISMDGSCNGLQHYAALGRDVEGGEQVNLLPRERPQDVYSGVAKLVNERVNELAAQGDEIGQLLQGKISRKVVKQTVMTSVYGVTLIGARKQIGNRLAEIEGFPEEKLFAASMKLASLTLSSLGDIFSGATRTMDWLYDAATRISRQGHEVQWTTAVGLPAVQPYRQGGRVVVKTLMQRVTLEKSGEHSAVSTARQRSAFAPNFVHSIDSAHMLQTAISCQRQGLRFAAVHDSFWTNAACVDQMNEVLREEFVRLHQRDLLEELRESFLIRYPGISFARVPPRGRLDLEVVKDSPYFFS